MSITPPQRIVTNNNVVVNQENQLHTLPQLLAQTHNTPSGYPNPEKWGVDRRTPPDGRVPQSLVKKGEGSKSPDENSNQQQDQPKENTGANPAVVVGGALAVGAGFALEIFLGTANFVWNLGK